MNERRLKVYIGTVYLAAALAALSTDWSALGGLPQPAVFGCMGLIVIGVLSEGLAIGLSVGAASSTSSITFLPLLAAVQLFGPRPTGQSAPSRIPERSVAVARLLQKASSILSSCSAIRGGYPLPPRSNDQRPYRIIYK